jgi:hypothetical protein
VLEYLRGREDAVLFGAHAVNAYTAEPHMTQGVDIMAVHAEQFAEELCLHLGSRFHIAVRVRKVKDGLDFGSIKSSNRRIGISSMFGRWTNCHRRSVLLTC